MGRRALVREKVGESLAQGSRRRPGWRVLPGEASRVGFSRLSRHLRACVSFLQEFSAGNVEPLGVDGAKGRR